MEALMTFLDMGGYAAFVWSAYGLSALVLGGLYVVSARALRQTEAELAALEGHAGAAADDPEPGIAEAARR